MSDDLRIAALLCSRVCHDLISPISALNNGLEVMADDDDEEMRRHAMDLIAMSGKQASAKLQFARLAYGASSTAGDELDLAEVQKILGDLFAESKVTLEWRTEGAKLDRAVGKILANLILIASDCIPRGGTLRIVFGAEGEAAKLVILAEGDRAKLNEDVQSALVGDVSDEMLNPRSIQPYLTGLIARGNELRILCQSSEDKVQIAVT